MLTRVDPLFHARRTADPLLDTVLDAFGWRALPTARPATAPVASVRTADDHYALTVEIPGVRLDDVVLEATRDTLTLSATRQVGVPEGLRAVRRERQPWRVQRTLTFPHPIDPDGVRATLQDGVLAVHVPKAAEARPRRVPVTRAEPVQAAAELAPTDDTPTEA